MKFCQICLLECESNVHDECLKRVFGTTSVPSFGGADIEEIIKYCTAQAEQNKMSLGGLQPKGNFELDGNILVPFRSQKQFFVKPEADRRFPEIAANEHLTSVMSHHFGVNTVKCAFLKSSDGIGVFVSRRFEMDGFIRTSSLNRVFGGDSSTKYENTSYEELGEMLRRSEVGQTEDYFSRVFFNLMVGNNDMHADNFDIGVDGTLSPQFDNVNARVYDYKKPAIKILKESENNQKDININILDTLGERLGVTATDRMRIYERFFSQSGLREVLIERSFLTDKKRDSFRYTLNEVKNLFLKNCDRDIEKRLRSLAKTPHNGVLAVNPIPEDSQAAVVILDNGKRRLSVECRSCRQKWTCEANSESEIKDTHMCQSTTRSGLTTTPITWIKLSNPKKCGGGCCSARGFQCYCDCKGKKHGSNAGTPKLPRKRRKTKSNK